MIRLGILRTIDESATCVQQCDSDGDDQGDHRNVVVGGEA